MYEFIFNFFYRYHKQGKTTQPRTTAALAVGTAIASQIFLVVSILKRFSIDILGSPLSKDYATNKILLLPFALVASYLLTWFYSQKRAASIINKWPKDYEILTMRNVSLIIAFMFLPLIIGIVLFNN